MAWTPGVREGKEAVLLTGVGLSPASGLLFGKGDIAGCPTVGLCWLAALRAASTNRRAAAMSPAF
ncbi:MAG: hypothetical protein AAFN63_01575 [Pseudomonadota bacterium]